MWVHTLFNNLRISEMTKNVKGGTKLNLNGNKETCVEQLKYKNEYKNQINLSYHTKMKHI